MRSLLLLSAIAALTACSDNGQSTTPARATRGEVGASAQRAPDGVSALGKPGSPGGLTVTVVIATGTTIPVGTSGTSAATCPAGTAVTGGGYDYTTQGTAPSVFRNRQLLVQIGTASGWTVSASNAQAGAADLSLTAWVSCAQ